MFGSSAWALSILALVVSAAASKTNLLQLDRTLIVMDSCNSKSNCQDCIQTPRCAWCADPRIKNKCFRLDIPPEPIEICPDQLKINRDNEFVVVSNRYLSRSSSSNITSSPSSLASSARTSASEIDSEVHFRPQEAILKLRINEPYRIKFDYSQPEVNPANLQHSEDSSSVEVKDNAASMIRIKYFSKCKTNTSAIETSKCFDLEVDDIVEFTAEIQVTSCPRNSTDWRQEFDIYPVGLNESLKITLDLICDCPCERRDHPMYEENAAACSGAGNFVCGICECDGEHFGKSCECRSLSNLTHNGFDDSSHSCGRNKQTLIECSGRGTCVCGTCHCESRISGWERIYGQFCECDNFSCNRHRGRICSGNGICDCGSCRCIHGWSGDSCSCRESNDTCFFPGDTEMCSGHGTCQCGECQCNDDGRFRYSGKFCDKCPTCPSLCNDLKTCVECAVHQSGYSNVTCASMCNGTVPLPVDVVVVNDDLSDVLCVETDAANCTYSFVYRHETSRTLGVRAQRTKECPVRVTP